MSPTSSPDAGLPPTQPLTPQSPIPEQLPGRLVEEQEHLSKLARIGMVAFEIRDRVDELSLTGPENGFAPCSQAQRERMWINAVNDVSQKITLLYGRAIRAYLSAPEAYSHEPLMCCASVHGSCSLCVDHLGPGSPITRESSSTNTPPPAGT